MIKSIVLAVIVLALLVSFVIFMPSSQSYLSLGLGAGIAVIFLVNFIVSTSSKKNYIERAAIWIPVLSLSTFFILLPIIFAALMNVWGAFSVATWVLMISLTLTMYYNFLNVPLAIYQKRRELKQLESPGYFPPISILIPAYNEEKVIARTLNSIIEASYPDKEIIVVDDGSKDQTYRIAASFEDRGVKVIHRPNGGKATALNHGLMFAKGDVIVVVDADSQISKNTLVELIKPFRNPEVAAVAGNIKVLNRVNILTKCQAIEYIASINIYRRALDVFGSVSVVPGALGAYRREVMKSGGYYDPDTLVEDFDLTVKALKTGLIVQASTSAISYTEAPKSIKDMIKQRLRWYRGNFQAIWKHRDILFNSRFGFLQRLSFPHMVISMIFLPLSGWVNVGAIIMVLIQGDGMVLVPAFLFFNLLQFFLSLLAIQLDNEDYKLAFYSPFLIFGYKQLCDLILMKSFFDVLFKSKKLKWTSAQRIGETTTGQRLN
ncbi:MAG: glycosyltransferase family 2 protein [Dehalococcoidales bacterium]|nr:glycosyltransferase family 2 protein [Dehalococcoidales bacterium]